ncbi:MAG: hypothetical protein ACOYL1_05750 [Chlamydiia bacterium]
MSIFQRLALILSGLTLIAFFGFYVGFRLQPHYLKIDSILFSSEHPSLIEPRWLVSYLKDDVLGNYPHIEIHEKQMHPIFRRLIATRYPPSSLYVHYCLRDVAFILEDYANLGIDSEGVLVALHPFQTPKKVVRIFLGERKGLKLGGALDEALMQKILFIHKSLPNLVTWIDLSKADAPLSRRTINLGLQQKMGKHSPKWGGDKTLLVRLSPDRLELGVNELRSFLKSVPIIGMDQVVRLDLRRKGVGFLQTIEKEEIKETSLGPLFALKSKDLR